ncbi:MAG: YbjN domain-containing protein [Cognatishimia sp.]
MSGLRTSVAAIMLAAPMALAANAEVMHHLSVKDMVAIMEQNDWPHDVQSNKETGDPVVTFEAEGYKIVMRAVDCAATQCEAMMVFANFDVGRPVGIADFLAVSDFNDANIRGRSYVNIQENKIGLDLVVDLRGGVTADHVLGKVTQFPTLVTDFLAHYVQFSEQLAAQQR